MQNRKAEILYKTPLQLGEGATWHPQWQKFLYVDIENGIVGSIAANGKDRKEVLVGKRVGAVAPASNDQLLVALQGSLALLNFETGALETLVEIEPDKPGNRCNDGKCDAAGRFWIGSMDVAGKERTGALYQYDDKVLTKMIDGRLVSNGLCWSPDNKTMYYVDSYDYDIKAYDFDVASGSISNKRVIVEMMVPGYTFDGMCTDAEGMLWVAVWGAGTVHRYNPANGMLLGKIVVDALHVSNCAFGGNDMQQLLITTARAGLSASQLEQYPLSGSLFIADTGIKGLNGYMFKG